MHTRQQKSNLVTELEKNKNIKLYNKFEEKFEFPIVEACKSNDLHAVKWLHLNSSKKCTTDAMDLACLNGNLEIVKFLHFNRTEGCTDDAIDEAARTGNLEIVKFLNDNRTEGLQLFLKNIINYNKKS